MQKYNTPERYFTVKIIKLECLHDILKMARMLYSIFALSVKVKSSEECVGLLHVSKHGV
jgi:hypothetical protein